MSCVGCPRQVSPGGLEANFSAEAVACMGISHKSLQIRHGKGKKTFASGFSTFHSTLTYVRLPLQGRFWPESFLRNFSENSSPAWLHRGKQPQARASNDHVDTWKPSSMVIILSENRL